MSREQAFADLVASAVDRERDQPRLTWWLSFADSHKPKGQQFLGVVLVDDCPGLVTARCRMAEAGVRNPGGEILGFGLDFSESPTDRDRDRVAAIARLPRLTVLSLEDLKAAGVEVCRT